MNYLGLIAKQNASYKLKYKYKIYQHHHHQLKICQTSTKTTKKRNVYVNFIFNCFDGTMLDAENLRKIIGHC
jgi:hypothetical protein